MMDALGDNRQVHGMYTSRRRRRGHVCNEWEKVTSWTGVYTPKHHWMFVFIACLNAMNWRQGARQTDRQTAKWHRLHLGLGLGREPNMSINQFWPVVDCSHLCGRELGNGGFFWKHSPHFSKFSFPPTRTTGFNQTAAHVCVMMARVV